MKKMTSKTTTFFVHQFNVSQVHTVYQAPFRGPESLLAIRVQGVQSSQASDAQTRCVYGINWHDWARWWFTQTWIQTQRVSLVAVTPWGGWLRGQNQFPVLYNKDHNIQLTELCWLSANESIKHQTSSDCPVSGRPVESRSPLCITYHRGKTHPHV